MRPPRNQRNVGDFYLREFRLKQDLSYRQLAALCDVDHSDIKKYEDGEKDLRLVTIVDLAIGLGIHPRELMNIDLEKK